MVPILRKAAGHTYFGAYVSRDIGVRIDFTRYIVVVMIRLYAVVIAHKIRVEISNAGFGLNTANEKTLSQAIGSIIHLDAWFRPCGKTVAEV